MLTAAGFRAAIYSSAEEFLETDATTSAGCHVFDVRLPGLSGLDLQDRLVASGRAKPVIFITAHDTTVARQRAAELNAVAFLVKPFESRLLVGAVDEALSQRPA